MAYSASKGLLALPIDYSKKVVAIPIRSYRTNTYSLMVR